MKDQVIRGSHAVFQFRPQVGAWIVVDGWVCGAPLKESDYPGACFRLRGPDSGVDYPVNVELVGEKIRFDAVAKGPRGRSSKLDGGFVRIKLSILDDVEAPVEVRGWAVADDVLVEQFEG